MKGDLVGQLGDMIFIIQYTILINKHHGVMLMSQLPARSGPEQHLHSLSREQFPARRL